MGKFEDLVEQLRDQGLDDLAEEFDQFGATALRKKAARADELESELQKAKAQVERFESAPKVEAAFRQAGVDFEKLRPADREVIQSLPVAELTEDKVGELIGRYEFPLIEGTQQQTGTTPPAAAVVDAAQQAPSGIGQNGKPASATVTPEQAGEWAVDTALRFKEKYPEEFEALKRGEAVNGIVFTP